MNKLELKIALDKINVPAHLYNFDGKGRTDERFCLSNNGEQWNVYYEERGIKTTNLSFESENAACDCIYNILSKNMERLMNGQNNYIPLGSVVLLRGATKKLIVIARAINVQNNGKQYFFDYGAVSYPEGLVGDQMAYFNSDAISKIVYIGYHDIEDEHMVDNINEYLEENPDLIKGSSDIWDN